MQKMLLETFHSQTVTFEIYRIPQMGISKNERIQEFWGPQKKKTVTFDPSQNEYNGKIWARSIPWNHQKHQKPQKDGKFHKTHQILNQTKRSINKLCFRKISLQKTLRTKFSVDSRFSNELCGKKRKPRDAGNEPKVF